MTIDRLNAAWTCWRLTPPIQDARWSLRFTDGVRINLYLILFFYFTVVLVRAHYFLIGGCFGEMVHCPHISYIWIIYARSVIDWDEEDGEWTAPFILNTRVQRNMEAKGMNMIKWLNYARHAALTWVDHCVVQKIKNPDYKASEGPFDWQPR